MLATRNTDPGTRSFVKGAQGDVAFSAVLDNFFFDFLFRFFIVL